MKYSFYNDYSEGAHPQIIQALQATNSIQEPGYGEDQFSAEATELIRTHIGDPNAAVHFVSSGTQANLIMLGSMLKSYQAVIAPVTAHIAVHEAGAIEATGHKIITVECADGKITPSHIESVCEIHTDEHMVQPRAVFISQATELGTIYSKQELNDISTVCKKRHLYLYCDGARLGSAIASQSADLNLRDLAKRTDAFYIGGTKNGALLGEAIVIVNPDLQKDFRYQLKQRGALLAKGRAVSVQFRELFKDDLYFELGKRANILAMKLSDGIRGLGYPLLTDCVTNQIFPIFPNTLINKLEKSYGFYVWKRIDESRSAVRLVTSWMTDEKAIDQFLSDLETLKKSVVS